MLHPLLLSAFINFNSLFLDCQPYKTGGVRAEIALLFHNPMAVLIFSNWHKRREANLSA